MSQEVICVIKDNRKDISSSIREIGTNAVYLSQEEAIELIKNDAKAFYITLNGDRVFITVGITFFGSEYLKTELDSDAENRLLDLPYCRFRKELHCN